MFEYYDPIFIFIQEIHVFSAIKAFSRKYQVFINLESESKDGIGIVTLVKHGISISDTIIAKNGRIIGLKISNIQLWNVYPQSGSAYKKEREIFFRETLCNLMMNWKDQSEYIFESGDHNCTHRLVDSLHNSAQHLQPGLIKHMQIHGLKDDFIEVHGNETVMYSRITTTSKTRIDYVLSNTSSCTYFQYIDMMLGLDHRAIIARYDISIAIRKEFIPQNKYFSGWVITKNLEFDDDFLEGSQFIFKRIRDEFMENKDDALDPSFYWLKAKTSIISLAKKREKDLNNLENERVKLLMGILFFSLK